MRKLSVTATLATIAILSLPAVVSAQGTGSSSSSPSTSPSSGPATGINTSPTGTNSAGTAQSSGGGLNTGEGVTTGAAGSESTDKAIAEENKTIDRKVKGICRGC